MTGLKRAILLWKEPIKYKLESALLQHLDVADAAVTGVPGVKETELARACVAPVRAIAKEAASFALGIQERSLEELLLTRKNVPKSILLSAPGKILRRELRDCATSDMVHGQVGIRVKL
ncbi:hypothetical protein BKA82DRAFT_4018979 [Pisolithus tinctorius]|nr:hypothetical protein BKA82DRAFT_4018979 [Pisolithus tinctorius]